MEPIEQAETLYDLIQARDRLENMDQDNDNVDRAFRAIKEVISDLTEEILNDK